MSIKSRRELELTRAKLKLLEERQAALVQPPEENRRARSGRGAPSRRPSIR